MSPEFGETITVENWYEVGQLSSDVYYIREPWHQEDVFCYLVKGSEQDLLIDTGMGVIPITRVLERIRNSSKPLIVANTHWHFDHVGGNSLFEHVKVPKNIEEVAGLLRGWSPSELARYKFVEYFKGQDGKDNTPPGFDPKSFTIPPFRNIDPVLKNGYKIGLGNRDIFVHETPGHTPGSVCFFDTTNELLFSGDTLYEGPLYAFEPESDPDKYLLSLKRIRKSLGSSIKTIHPGHNYADNSAEPDLITQSIKLLQMAKAKKPWDERSNEFDEAVEYIYPGISKRFGNGKRRLKVLVNESYVKW
jgi:glyoxylase-like metal-dependent hydrolase (beta-lactamase superfamily II)